MSGRLFGGAGRPALWLLVSAVAGWGGMLSAMAEDIAWAPADVMNAKPVHVRPDAGQGAPVRLDRVAAPAPVAPEKLGQDEILVPGSKNLEPQPIAPAAQKYLRILPPDDEDWAEEDLEEDAPVTAALAPPAGEPSLEARTDAEFADSGLLLTPISRVRDVVPADIQLHFDLYLYVSKAAEGAFAQHMWVFERTGDGALSLTHFWPVSTGRERQEGYFTTTPAGLYKLDPHRFKRVHYSSVWGGARMPFAMFLDYGYRTQRSGLAIHGTMKSTYPALGSRASGGCIRVATDNARFLFNLIQGSYRGQVPAFAFDEINGHTDRTGQVKTDEKGETVFVDGLRALLIVDDFGGPGA